MVVPFLSFDQTNSEIKNEILNAFESFFDSAWYVLGNSLKQFENEYAEFNGVNHAIGVSNGLDALHLSLRALGISAGDEVLVPANTFIATALAVSFVGAKPVFVEPDPFTCNIDTERIAAAVTKKTKAIIPVHLYGQACRMIPILDLAKSNKLFVIEDNAQAQGATFHGKLTGSFGEVNGTSFYPGKNLGALGDGGMITTNSDQIAHKLHALRNYGSHTKYEHEMIGFNMRLDEIQAAFLSVKLKRLSKWTERRVEIANLYFDLLAGVGDLQLPAIADGATHVFHLFVVQTSRRDQLRTFLMERQISTLIHYPTPPYLQKAYAHLGHKVGDFPIAEKIAQNSLSLPLWPGMTESMVEYVCENVRQFYD